MSTCPNVKKKQTIELKLTILFLCFEKLWDSTFSSMNCKYATVLVSNISGLRLVDLLKVSQVPVQTEAGRTLSHRCHSRSCTHNLKGARTFPLTTNHVLTLQSPSGCASHPADLQTRKSDFSRQNICTVFCRSLHICLTLAPRVSTTQN